MRQALVGSIAALLGWLLSRLTGGALPPFAAATAIIERDGMLLTVERRDGFGFNLPGGFLRWQEHVDAGLKREVWEETGYHIEVGPLLGVYSGPAPNQRLSSVVVAYTATIVGGSERGSYEGRVRWLEPAALFGKMAFANEEVVVDYLRMRETA